MTHRPHDLHEEFPQFAEKIGALKQTDAHFARLAADYHEVNHQVHRAETLVEPMDDLAEMDLRKKRARLKDDIFRLLSA